MLVAPKGQASDDATLPEPVTPTPQRVEEPAGHPPTSKAPAQWKDGKVLEDLYEVKSLLGRGGMGEVWLVHHNNWNVDLAVKRPLASALERAGGKDSYITEAETWVNLPLHPNVVQAFYVRTLTGDDTPCIFAEYCEGGSLKDWVAQGKTKDLKTALDIAIQIGWGMAHAHEQSLVHRDLKPGNVLMTPSGEARITDFGLARSGAVTGEEADDNQPSSVEVTTSAGTAGYAAPEQMRKGATIDHRADIFAFGATLWRTLGGPLVWTQTSGSVAKQSVTALLKRGEVRDLPDGLAELILRCLEPQPADRPPDFLTVCHELKAVFQVVATQEYPRPQPFGHELLADGLNNRAVSLVDLGRKQGALALLREAVETGSHCPEAQVNLALLSKDESTVSLLRDAVAAAPGVAWPRAYLAKAVSGYDDIEVRQEALRLFPNDAHLKKLLETHELPLVLARISASREELQWDQEAARLLHDIRSAEARKEWETFGESTRQLLQIPKYHLHRDSVDRLRNAASHRGERMLARGDAWWRRVAVSLEHMRLEPPPTLGVDIGHGQVHGAVILGPREQGGSDYQVVSLPAAVFLTAGDKLEVPETCHDVRRWVASVHERGVKLRHRTYKGLEVFEAERDVDGVRALFMGIRSAMERPEVVCAEAAGSPFTALDLAACLLSEVRRRVSGNVGMDYTGAMLAVYAPAGYRNAAAWELAATMAGFQWARVVNGTSVAAMALVAHGHLSAKDNTRMLVVQAERDCWVFSLVDVGAQVFETQLTEQVSVEPLSDTLASSMTDISAQPALDREMAFHRVNALTLIDAYPAMLAGDVAAGMQDPLLGILHPHLGPKQAKNISPDSGRFTHCATRILIERSYRIA